MTKLRDQAGEGCHMWGKLKINKVRTHRLACSALCQLTVSVMDIMDARLHLAEAVSCQHAAATGHAACPCTGRLIALRLCSLPAGRLQHKLLMVHPLCMTRSPPVQFILGGQQGG